MIVVTLDEGSDLLAEIEQFVRRNDVAFCRVSGIGSLAEAHVSYYDQAEQTDRELAFERPMMLTALNGTAAKLGDDVDIHCHLVLGDAQGAAFGGDLSPGCTVFSCELVLSEMVGPQIVRNLDEATGLSRLGFA
jgi:predicted DNA-binding protein with PD1-like motif